MKILFWVCIIAALCLVAWALQRVGYLASFFIPPKKMGKKK